MSGLQLTIPAQNDDNRGKRIKPREVREWLENLPCLDMQRAARLLNEQLRLMNRQLVAPAARLEMLGDFLRTYLRLLESSPADPADAAQLQSLLKRLSQNIGFGYKIVLHELVNKKAGLLEARHLPAALLGAVHTLGLQLMHYYAGYQRAPHALWNECLAIYRYARKTGRASWRGELPGVGAIGIDESFRLTALLRLADPYRLPAGAIRALESWFRARIALADIESDPDDAQSAQLLALHNAGHTSGEADIAPLFLNPAALMARMPADIKKLEQYKSTRALELPDDISASLLATALRQVLKNWQASPVRKAAREEAVTRIELVGGLDAAYCVLNNGRPFDPALFLKSGRDEIIDVGRRAAPEPVARKAFEPLHCSSQDRSNGGLCVSWRGAQGLKPHVGQLFALRRAVPAASAWVVAVCRWLTESEPVAGFDIGLQYLAREPAAVVIRPLDGSDSTGDYQPAIVATQKRGERTVHTLIARGNLLVAGRTFAIYTGDGQQQARCVELLETGHGFDRFIYQPIS